ncbi:SFT1-SNARE [Purpureocillium lavendulum]|uniref:SFT1-SNARE n=1 Tax=Purpureocillium lavendulum TaxID=1247861 RepID=A0AB34FFQ5_9HYPO|nr:SFT1-SNARE [Purpureocillium lavendulum]
MTSLDCYEKYHFSPPLIETVKARYDVARCTRCHEDHGQLHNRIASNWANKLARKQPEEFEAYAESKLRELLKSIEKNGIRPQLLVSYGGDERSIGPESSGNEAVDLAWPLLTQVVEDTLQWARGYGA